MVTLDALHQESVGNIKSFNVDQNEMQLASLQKEFDETDDPERSMFLNNEIEKLKNKIDSIKSGDSLKNYYLDAGDILFKYYGNDNSHVHVNSHGSGDIMSYLKCDEPNDEVPPDDGFFYNNESREDLQNDFISRLELDYRYSKKNVSKVSVVNPKCNICNEELFFSPSEATVECVKCGTMETIVNETEKASYKDHLKETCFYSYRRANHFNEWISQFQGKETTTIPHDVLIIIIKEIKKERIKDLSSLTPTKIRSILKKLKLNKYYEHVPFIINQLNGKAPPYMSRRVEEVLRSMFQTIQAPFMEVCPKNRKNFLSYSYVLHKFVELLGLDNLKPLFPLLKSREKLFAQDTIWRQICLKLDWPFHKSI